MSAGDRLINPTNGGYATHEVTNETGDSSGYKQAALLVKQVDDSGNTLGGTGASADQVQGNVAHDAVDAGNPVSIGGRAASSAPADVANGDRVKAYFDLKGRLVVLLDSGLPAGEAHVGEVGGRTVIASAAQFTRPSDTTAYASGDLVANSTTAGSVVPLQFTVARIAAGSGMIRRARIRKSGTGVTSASFRLHLYTASPTPANGDNSAWSTSGASTYLGALDVTVDRAFTDGAAGNGTPVTGSEINFALSSGQIIYGLLEARGAYTPGNAETFDVSLEVLQN